MPTPTNKSLYEKAKKKVYSLYKKASAYRSGALQKEYKKLGGEYSGEKKNGNLTRWFAEKWGDIAHKDYPVYRPSKRINNKTPLLAREIDPINLSEQIKLKQKYRGSKNLPPFQPKLV